MAQDKVLQFAVGGAKVTYTFGDKEPVEVKFSRYQSFKAETIGEAIKVLADALQALGDLNIEAKKEAKNIKLDKELRGNDEPINLDELPF